MLIKLPTEKSVTEAATALHAAVQANHFGVMQVRNLTETMAKKGRRLTRERLVFEVCQPCPPRKAFDTRMSVSPTAACQISIYEEGGRTTLATLTPTTLLAMFKAPRLDDVVKIMKQAAAA